MDAAQMLTAKEIARQCERMARVAEQPPGELGASPSTVPGAGRHLRLAEPITQPIERVTGPTRPTEPAGSAPSGPEPDEATGHTTDDQLTAREYGILAFERQWWKRAGAKEQAIRELFDMSSSRYYQLLNALVDKPAALRVDPMLIKRLRRARQARQLARNSRGSGIEY